MANIQAPFGFSPFIGNGAVSTYEQVVRRIAYNNATPIYTGDPVVSLGSGYIAQATAGTTQIAGIFVGCKYLSTAMKRTVWNNYWPGSDVAVGNDVEAYIINDPNMRFLAQAGGAATPIAFADLDANINFGLGTGNASTGRSGAFADQTTIAVTATLPFRIVDLIQAPPGANGSDITTAYNYVVLAFNNVDTKSLTGIV